MARRISLDRVIVRSAIGSLHLCDAAIHEQFRSRNVAGVVRCEKNYSVAISSGRTEPAERNSIRDRFLALFAHFRGGQQVTQSGRIDGARAHRVHANAAIL
jgi:hypothetical protein